MRAAPLTTSSPRIIITIHHTGSSDRPWCVRWQTLSMSGPAFWYYSSRFEAEMTARKLQERREAKAS